MPRKPASRLASSCSNRPQGRSPWPELLGLAGLLVACGGGEKAPQLTFEELVARDSRISPLIAGCQHGMAFTTDTSDMTRVLAEKLATGQLERIRRAKDELASMGEAAMPDLQRVFDGAYSESFQQGVLTNVLDVCALMEVPAGVPLALRALDHPGSTVRLNAFHVLRRHGGPEHYDQVALFLEVPTTSQRAEVVETMAALDEQRLAGELITWVDEGLHADQHKAAVPLVMQGATAEQANALWARRESLDPELISTLNAMAARHGNEEALDLLRGNLVDEINGLRRLALAAIMSAGLEREALVVAQQDPVATMRYAAVETLTRLEPTDEVVGWLEPMLGDVDQEVRTAVMGALVPTGNQAAQAAVLDLLAGSLGEREDAVFVLRAAYPKVEGLDRRALDLLQNLYEVRVSATPAERVSYLQAIAAIPLAEAAAFVMDACDRPEVRIGGMSGHRWAAIQVFNSGAAGFDVLAMRLAEETDLFRRIDLLHSLWQFEDPAASELLRGLVTDETRSPYEVLYASSRLARLGPSAEIAPFLKRVYLGNTDAIVRPGLQCLLWDWYG